MTAAPDDGSRNLRGRTDSCVGPDDRVLDPGPFLDKTTLAQHRIDDLGPWLDLTLVADQGSFIDLGYRGCVENTASIFDVNAPNLASQQISMYLQVTLWRADIDPVSARRNMSKEWLFTFQDIRKQAVFK